MPIIHNFESTTVWKAFTLNALATSLAVCVALFIKMKYDRYFDQQGNEIREVTSMKSIYMSFTITFITTFLAYTSLHFIFGYGGGQLIDTT